jgi:chromosomal replication initiation ATPase DnaA
MGLWHFHDFVCRRLCRTVFTWGICRKADGIVTQLILPLETPSAFGRADFIVAPGNEQAIAFIDSWPHWPAPAATLYGPSASGKSHLAAVWASKAGAITLEANALEGVVPDGPLVVENIAAGVAEAPLFALLERGAPLLLTAQAPPSRWPVVLPDLKSRANAMLAFALWAPDDALLMGLAVKLFADRQVQVPENVIAHMIQSLERSPAVIRDFVARADAAALIQKKPITLNLIKDLLARQGSTGGP